MSRQSAQLGSLIIDLAGQGLTSEERALLAHPQVGGLVLFARNYASFDQLQQLCHDIRAVRKAPLLILADQEGGRVQRFQQDFTMLPSMASFGRLYAQTPELACDYAKACGWLMAAELLEVGVDASLAPVLDLDKKISTVIGDRAFHAEPHPVIALAGAFIEGMREAGMAATGKHFPGHGSVALDSHFGIPVDTRPYHVIEKEDLSTFAALIQQGLPAIVPAHLIFSEIDEQLVTYSQYWLQVILREKLGFQGLILSDDLNMEGANIFANYVDRFEAAKRAGCDFVLLCNNRKAVIQLLDTIKTDDPYYLPEHRWMQLQAKRAINSSPLKQQPRWQVTKKIMERL